MATKSWAKAAAVTCGFAGWLVTSHHVDPDCLWHILALQTASFYSWQPPLSGQELVSKINTQLQAQWEAAAAAAGTGATQNGSGGMEHDGSSDADAAGAAADMQQCQLPPLCPLRVWQAELVQRQFHATFGAKWRRYVYLLPLRAPHHTAGEADLLTMYSWIDRQHFKAVAVWLGMAVLCAGTCL